MEPQVNNAMTSGSGAPLMFSSVGNGIEVDDLDLP